MTAQEARVQSIANAKIIAQRDALAKKKAARDKEAAWDKKKKEWRAKFSANIARSIKFYTEQGWREIKDTLHSGSSSSHPLYGKQSFLDNFEFSEQLQSAIKDLEGDGYTVILEGISVEHDDRAAYLNSGGECGSEGLYWTYDTVLKISW